MTHYPSRRTLLRLVGSTAGALALNRLAMTSAFAQAAPDYKALVCIFMYGGNDSHNMLIPQDPTAFAAYKKIRGNLALPDNDAKLLPITTKTGANFAFSDGLAEVAPLWASGQLAAVANVGMLSEPTTRQQYLDKSVSLPTNLFSHEDQVVQKQAGDPNGSGGTGWGGRIADATNSLNGTAKFPATFSISGPVLFGTGNAIQSASLYPGFDLSASGMNAYPNSAAVARTQALQEILALNSGLTMVQEANRVRQDAANLNAMLRSAGAVSPLKTVFPGGSLGQQLRQIAQIISLRAKTGMNRQVFFASLGGFDTHSAQSWAQWDLFRQVGGAMKAFYDATVEMGVADKVTTFTETDFGRTLQPSGTGSDHGWGGHHLVMGGAVRGGDIYGTFPIPALGGPDDANSRGVLIPTTSLDQYGATLAKWFGVSAAAMPQVFPNIGKFPTADVGFLA
jgi:uncharacterized protein (DUF1501 family)